MKKSDLRTGMVVVNRSGDYYIIIKNAVVNDSMVGKDGYDNLDNFNENFDSKNDYTILDIMKVYSPNRGYGLRQVMNGELDEKELKLIWERRDIRKEIDILMEEKKALTNRLYNIDSEVSTLALLGGR